MKGSSVPRMRAVRYRGPRQVALLQVSRPQPGPGEVLLRVRAAGICGSDLHWYRGEWEQLPTTPGHEVGAVVAALGEGVSSLAIGQPVCLEPLVRCGRCPQCRDGAYNYCERFTLLGGIRNGGMADYVVAPAYAVYPLPPEVPPEQGSLVEPLAVATHALRQAPPVPGEAVLVIGAGTIGLAATTVAHDLGARVSVIARHPHQARVAQALGAEHLAAPGDAVPLDHFSVVVETAGTDQALALATSACRRRGAILTLASAPVSFDLTPVVLKGLRLLGSVCYCAHGGEPDFARAMALLARRPELARLLITHRFPLEQAAEAFAIADDKRAGGIKVVLEP